MLPGDELKPPTPPMSRARGCLGFTLLSAGLLTLISGAAAFLPSRGGSFWTYEFEVERSLTGASSGSSSFTGGMSFSPATLSIWLMLGGAMLAGSLFVYRRNFSLRFMLACVFVIGILGMLPGKYVKPPFARMSMACRFDKPFSDEQMKQLKLAMEPKHALATLPDTMLGELNLNANSQIGLPSVSQFTKSNRHGAKLEIVFAPEMDARRREALAEFYAHYFQELCFAYAKANGVINDTTTASRPWVTGRFYIYLKEWDENRSRRERK